MITQITAVTGLYYSASLSHNQLPNALHLCSNQECFQPVTFSLCHFSIDYSFVLRFYPRHKKAYNHTFSCHFQLQYILCKKVFFVKNQTAFTNHFLSSPFIYQIICTLIQYFYQILHFLFRLFTYYLCVTEQNKSIHNIRIPAFLHLTF